MIGMHLIIDGVLVRHLEKEDIGLILSELPAEIGMKILEGPYIVEGHQENPGLTGFVIIDISHISIHTFDEGSKIAFDIFSCRPFDEDTVLRYLKKHVPFERFHKQILTRTEKIHRD
jgi:S-adenosylmethionine decarboxylase